MLGVKDIGRRQTRQVLGTHGDGVSVLGVELPLQETLQVEDHVLADQEGVLRVEVAPAVRVGVEGRADYHLEAQGRSAPVARHQGAGGGQIAARAVAGHRQSARVGVEPRGVFGDPAERVVTVLGRRGIGIFWRPAVVDADHLGAGLRRQTSGDGVVGRDAAGDPSAAVEIEDHRFRTVTVGPVNADRDFAAGRADEPVAHRDVRWIRLFVHLGVAFEPCTPFFRRDRLGPRPEGLVNRADILYLYLARTPSWPFPFQ